VKAGCAATSRLGWAADRGRKNDGRSHARQPAPPEHRMVASLRGNHNCNNMQQKPGIYLTVLGHNHNQSITITMRYLYSAPYRIILDSGAEQ